MVIPEFTITCIGAAATLCFVLPFLVLIAYKKNTHASLRPFAYGIVIFLSFAMALEQILHTLVLDFNHPLSRLLQSSPWAYAIYGGLAAGLFEETGRFIAFRILKKENENSSKTTPIMYGIGHGGAEVIITGALYLFNTMIMATTFNTMGIDAILADAGEQAPALQMAIDQAAAASPYLYFISPVECSISFILQISLSVLVYCSVMYPEANKLFPITLLLHFLISTLSTLHQTEVISTPYLMSVILLACTLGVAFYAYRVYQKYVSKK